MTVLPHVSLGVEKHREYYDFESDFEHAHENHEHMEAIIELCNFLIIVVGDPEKEPEYVHHSGENQQKANFVFFILKDPSKIIKKLTSSWLHMTARKANRGRL